MRRSICFAGGCFWGMEALYRRLPGVLGAAAGCLLMLLGIAALP